MALSNPFSGQRSPAAPALIPPVPIEQRLFQKLPAPSATKPEGREAKPTEPADQTTPVVANTEMAQAAPAPKSRRRLDLDEQPLYKNSFLFTQEEEAALDELKLTLKRELDAKVTKETLMRAALHLLVEDYQAKGAGSYVVKKLGRRVSK